MRIGRFVWLIFLPALGHAGEVYRCTGSAGEPLFSQRPCGPAGAQVVEIDVPPAGPSHGLRASEHVWLAGRERRLRSPSAGRTEIARKPMSGQASQAARRAYLCKRKRDALEAVRAELRRGYKPAKGERLRRRRRAHEDYLATFCS